MDSDRNGNRMVDSQISRIREIVFSLVEGARRSVVFRRLVTSAIVMACVPFVSYPQDLWSQINLDLPGLSSVRLAVEKKDFKAAERELLQYFRSRTNRAFTHFNLHGDSSNVYRFGKNGILLRGELVNFGPTIDWSRKGMDREWNYSLNRMAWLVEYAAVYEAHPDENIVRAFVDQVTSWIHRTDGPGFPRTIDTGNRLYYWCIAHWYFVQQKNIPGITPEFNAEMLKSMAAQAEFLYAPEHWRRFSNWGTFENSGLAYVAIMFPEFKRSQEWMNEIRFRLHFQLSNSYNDDGFHTEVSPSYHAGELEVLFGIARAAEENRIPLALPSQVPIPSVRSLILKPAEALMYMLQPNGTTPNVGDTDEEDETKLLRELAAYLGREDMKYVSTFGQSGTVPERSSLAFPKAGYYVMRSGWGNKVRSFAQEMYMMFDNGLNSQWHAHYDQLNLTARAYGQPLLRDAGKYTYNDDPDRAYFKGTAAHNTVVIDSHDQPADNNPMAARWIATRGFDFVSGAARSSATHRRSVLFVKPEYWIVVDKLSGEGSHRYEQFWHLDAATAGNLEYDPTRNQLQSTAMVLASPATEPSYTLSEGWFSRRYRERVHAPLLKRSETRAGSFSWSTVILPTGGVSARIRVERISAASGDRPGSVILKLGRGTTTDFFFEGDSLRERVSFEGLETDGSILFARRAAEREVAAFFLAGGSFIVADNDTIVAFNHIVESASLVEGELTVETPWPVAMIATGHNIQSVQINGRPVELNHGRNRTQYKGDRLRR